MGLKLKVTRGPHQTQSKVSPAALEKWKKNTLIFKAKINGCEKIGQISKYF